MMQLQEGPAGVAERVLWAGIRQWRPVEVDVTALSRAHAPVRGGLSADADVAGPAPVGVNGGSDTVPLPADTVSLPADTVSLPADVVQLRAAVEGVLAQDPTELPEAQALARAGELLALSERLNAAVLSAVVDVDARQSFVLQHAGSARSWLRRSPCGDRGQLAVGRRLDRYERVRAGLADGLVGLAAAEHVTRELDRLPEHVPADQLAGVLENGLPDVLDAACGGPLTADCRTPRQVALAEQLQQVVSAALADVTAAPAQRLEPAFTLLAGVLPLRQLQDATGLLLDALVPRRVTDEEERGYENRSWRLVRKRLTPGYRLEADLTVEDGLALQAEMDARAAAADAAAAAMSRQDPASGATGATGAAPSVADPSDPHPSDPDPSDPDPSDAPPADGGSASATDPGHPVSAGGCPARTAEQQRYAVFMDLLRDAATARGGGTPTIGVTVTATLAALEGAAGVLPGTMLGPDGRISLSAEAVRRLACGGPLSVILLDAARTPVGASSTRRHATARERRALRARQGDLCGVAGCPNLWTVPHHVQPWWMTGRTVLADLLGICEHCHHDVHDGHRTLLLRDGRLIGETGWIDEDGPG